MEMVWRSEQRLFEANSIELSPDPGDGPISVRVRPSSIERDCDRRTTSTGRKASVNHAKSRLTLEPLRPERRALSVSAPPPARAPEDPF
jgi:hypothetical protein